MKRICLVKGQHTNREYAKECPVLQAKRRAERRQEGRVTGSETGAAIPLQGTPLEQPPARTSPVDSDKVSITSAPDATAMRAARGGRPRKHASDLIARREAQRAYRAREKRSEPRQ